ncbi:hypothetical protein ABLG96_09490 [Nakamurella sp. A5-74]|uniref:Uncharacterized protein n=1 Tax=Nakamurella sp. A5-74 TaxID=3158264 RepID=A0AAU8DVJ3_9ACTN
MHRPQVLLAALVSAVLLGGCAETGTASSTGSRAAGSTVDSAASTPSSGARQTVSAAPTTAPHPVAVSVSSGPQNTPPTVVPRTTRTTASSTHPSKPGPADPLAPSEVSDAGGPVPPCGYEQPAITPGEPDATPAPDTCQFTGGSPACPTQATAVVDSGTTRQVEPSAANHPPILGGFGRWGGQRGGSMCFTEFADQSVQMTNGNTAILVVHNDNAIINAERIELARSAGVRGIVSGKVVTVMVRDPARPQGVEARLYGLDNGTGPAAVPTGAEGLRIFLAPVSSGPATVTAYDSSGAELGAVTLP